MKRKIAMALTLIMMMALILPQTALAIVIYAAVAAQRQQQPARPPVPAAGGETYRQRDSQKGQKAKGLKAHLTSPSGCSAWRRQC